jgi:hypothetical protein
MQTNRQLVRIFAAYFLAWEKLSWQELSKEVEEVEGDEGVHKKMPE